MTAARRGTVVALALVALASLASLAAERPPRAAVADRPEAARPWHFAVDVLPWLTRQGCAAAECHGGGLGRGGLKLSLFGGEPRADWEALVVDRDGRRIDLANPQRSLALAKPDRSLPHRGGRRLPGGTPAWRAVHDWIAAGAPWATGPTPRVEALELELGAADAAADDSGAGGGPPRLRAFAEFAWDVAHGVARQREEVSDRAVFASTAPEVAAVDAGGAVRLLGPGVAWLTARFGGRDAALRVVRPFGEQVAATSAAPLDRAWLHGLRDQGLAPGPRADDATLLRRLTLTLAGRIPTADEVQAFDAGAPESRIAGAVERLLASDDFAATAAGWLADWFEVPPTDAVPARLRGRDAALRARLRALVDAEAPLPAALAAMVAVDDAALARFADARDRAEFVGRALLGVRLGCARCHDHPQDRWTRADHLGFSALFADPRPGADGGAVPGLLFDDRDGAAVTPDATAVLPTAVRADLAAVRDALATDPRVARALANRVFAALTGRGLVDPVDDHRLGNPPRHPELLDALVAAFRDGGGRLRPLVRTIAGSAAFARASAPAGDDPLAAARGDAGALAIARALPEATFRASVATALGVPFDDPAPPAATPLAVALHRRHGTALTAALADPTNAVRAIADFVATPDAQLDALFELLLSRAPRAAEREVLLPRLAAAEDPADWLCTAARAMFCSREFTSIR